jgi:hypothetical protein
MTHLSAFDESKFVGCTIVGDMLPIPSPLGSCSGLAHSARNAYGWSLVFTAGTASSEILQCQPVASTIVIVAIQSITKRH